MRVALKLSPGVCLAARTRWRRLSRIPGPSRTSMILMELAALHLSAHRRSRANDPAIGLGRKFRQIRILGGKRRHFNQEIRPARFSHENNHGKLPKVKGFLKTTACRMTRSRGNVLKGLREYSGRFDPHPDEVLSTGQKSACLRRQLQRLRH